MKYLGKSYIISEVLLFLMLIFSGVVGVIFNNILIGIFISFVIIVFLVILTFNFKVENSKQINKLLNDKYNQLKCKESITLFERLYIQAYDDTANDIMEKIIVEENITNIDGLDFDCPYNKEYITMTLIYKKHIVNYHIYKNKFTYYIDSPKKYDHLECNKEYEQIKKSDISILDYQTLELFLGELVPSIMESIREIEDFEENVNLLVINEKTLEEINDYKGFNKEMQIFLNVLSIILIGIVSGLTYWFIIDYYDIIKEELLDIIFPFISMVLLDLFAVGSFLYSIYGIIYCKIINKDIKTQLVDIIKDKVYKVKIIKVSVGYKASTRSFCCGIKLYFKDKKKLKLVFPHYFEVPTKEQKSKIIKEFLKKELELKYYKRSKIVVNGLESYRKVIRRIMRKK